MPHSIMLLFRYSIMTVSKPEGCILLAFLLTIFSKKNLCHFLVLVCMVSARIGKRFMFKKVKQTLLSLRGNCQVMTLRYQLNYFFFLRYRGVYRYFAAFLMFYPPLQRLTSFNFSTDQTHFDKAGKTVLFKCVKSRLINFFNGLRCDFVISALGKDETFSVRMILQDS